jgi:subtilisin family serine protease
MKRIIVTLLGVALTVSLLLTSVSFAAGGGDEGVPSQTVLDASVAEVSAVFDVPKEDLEIAASRESSFGDRKFLLSTVVDTKSKQAYMVSADAQGKVWIAEPKIEDEMIDHMSQMKPDETVTISIWAIYVSPEEELWQIPSKYPDVPFEGYRPALGANVSAEALAAIEADVREIKLRAHEVAVQPVVEFLEARGNKVVYVSKFAPTVDAELGKEDIYNLGRLIEVESISLPGRLELCMDSAGPFINADLVWNEGYDGGGTDGTFGESKYYPYWYQTQIAVVDTGIDFGHPALQHANGGTYPEGVLGDGLFPSHGTQVAGCIASMDATRRGVAYGAELLDADFGVGDLDEWNHVKEVCDWAQSYEEYGNRADLYNFSQGWPNYRAFDNDQCRFFDHIAYEWHRLSVCCAGNTFGGDPVYNNVRSPANAFNALAVGGIRDETTPPTMWDGSSWVNPLDGREKPEVCAPATSIVTTELGGGWTPYPYVEGTSFAAPQVVGIAAQLLEQDQSLVYWPEVTKAIIMASAIQNVVPNPPRPTGVNTIDDHEGVGTVDAYAAYQCVAEGHYTSRWRPNDDGFYIQFDAVAGQKVRFVINVLAHTDWDYSHDYDELCSDFDFWIEAPPPFGYWRRYYSTVYPDTNPWDIIEFNAQNTGTYRAYIWAPRFDTSYEWVGAAWCVWWPNP